MSNITSLLSNGYYSLNNQSPGTPLGQSTAGGIGGLAQALSTGASSSSKADSAYALDLSEDALAYIKSINGSAPSAAGSYANATHFTLTRNQQETLDSIIANYKDAPFTQETFSKLQDDLKDAGLSPETLGIQDTVRHFNATQFLLDALNGTNSSDTDMFSNSSTTADASTKATNFMTSVADQWARISSTVRED